MAGHRQHKNGWSEEDKQFLRDNWDTMTNEQFSLKLNRSLGSIQTMASKELGLKRSAAALSQRLVNAWKRRPGTWSDAEKQYLIDNWQTLTRSEIATALGRTPSAIKSMGEKEMGLKKTPAAVAAIMKRNRNCTQFKNGNMPYNTIYGDELVIRVRKNKNNPAYKWIRIGFRQWKQYHIWLWEQTKGPVPEGHLVTFINGNQMDVRLDNLEISTRAEHVIKHSASVNLTDKFVVNTIARADKELKDELLKYPELIELKRTQIQLNRSINREIAGN